MKNQRETKQSRREMFRSAARGLVLGGLAVLSAGLLGTKKGTGPICRDGLEGASHRLDLPPSSACRRCAALASCSLPLALATRKQSKR